MREIILQNKKINSENSTFIIAEIGNNHQGSLKLAYNLVDQAVKSGVDAVKFQKRDNRSLFTDKMYQSDYASDNSFAPTYGAHRDKLELSKENFAKLKKYCDDKKIIFFATPFDMLSLKFLEEIKCPFYKVASADHMNVFFLREISKLNKPIILSTGGGTFETIELAHRTINEHHNLLAILQCTAAYPCKPEEMNLNVITSFMKKYPNNVIGLSDHQNGISMALVAFTLGARIIEKHFTLDRTMKGTDHKFSLEPQGLSKLVRDIRRAELALGSSKKEIIESEINPIKKMGKKLVASKSLKKGSIIKSEDIALKSPQDGLKASFFDNLIGKKLIKNLNKDEDFKLDYFD